MTRLLYLPDLVGVAVFAASGALAAMASGLDLLGILVIASVTAGRGLWLATAQFSACLTPHSTGSI